MDSINDKEILERICKKLDLLNKLIIKNEENNQLQTKQIQKYIDKLNTINKQFNDRISKIENAIKNNASTNKKNEVPNIEENI